MMTFYIYNYEDEDNDDFLPKSAMKISDFLSNPPSWKPRLDKVILVFDNLPFILNEDFNSFGLLNHILPQLEELIVRLTDGKFGLLRTCTQSEALFFIFKPKLDTILFSSLGVLPLPFNTYFPLKNSPNYFKDIDQQKELYEFIKANNLGNWKETLIGHISEIEDIEYKAKDLIKSINEQIKLSNQLMDFLKLN
ncbi:conserved hypothetical protein [Flavobacterium sp. 9AF]|uniref:hypothetical protein n=1 Tax=Flavobacterium sp. 9AF TaxID=2653142 RepID=UPI0012EFA9D1|nr:hypothetical protein [Flavobacterium sp. 9AF]VXB29527.1 conserved hypothetical protein [Flavobacterium sp. 9AF]